MKLALALVLSGALLGLAPASTFATEQTPGSRASEDRSRNAPEVPLPLLYSTAGLASYALWRLKRRRQ